MKRTIQLFFMLLVFGSLSSQSKMTIGRCTFEGKQPKTIVSIGGVKIYHNGTMKCTGTSGGVNVWTGNGDVWVIFFQFKRYFKV